MANAASDLSVVATIMRNMSRSRSRPPATPDQIAGAVLRSKRRLKVALAEAARRLEHAFAKGEPRYQWVDGGPDSNNWIDYYDISWNLIGALHGVVFHRKSGFRQIAVVPLFDRGGITVADVERAPIDEVFGFIVAVNAAERICDGLYGAYLDNGVAAAAAGRIRQHLAEIMG